MDTPFWSLDLQDTLQESALKKVKVDNTGAAQAAAAQAAAQTAANNLQTNFATDLSTDNQGQVAAAGTADMADTSTVGSSTKRKRASGSLSSQLGIS